MRLVMQKHCISYFINVYKLKIKTDCLKIFYKSDKKNLLIKSLFSFALPTKDKTNCSCSLYNINIF